MANMEEMIREEINKIDSLQERVLFKEVIEQIFLSLHETNRKMYEALEKRIMEELSFDIHRYVVSCLIADRRHIDRSHHFLFPVREQDLANHSPDLEGIRKDWEEKGRSLVKTFFLEADYLQIRKLLEKEKVMGTLLTDKREIPVELMLEKNTDYIEETAHLYEIFVRNGVTWKTLNVPYLHKFLNVYLPAMELVNEGQERLEEIKVDLGEFSDMAKEPYLPLWNIRRLTLSSVGFPVPCEDHKHFEHTVSIREYGDEHVYLIDEENSLYHLRQLPGRLVVTGKEAETKKWTVYQICRGQNKRFERFLYPLLNNGRMDSFPEMFWKQQNVRVRTGSELHRFIRGYGLEEYIIFFDYSVEEAQEETESYSMNGFLLEEIRRRDCSHCLRLLFRGSGRYPFLERDIMSFLVSEVQLLYPEYHCVGKLIQ